MVVCNYASIKYSYLIMDLYQMYLVFLRSAISWVESNYYLAPRVVNFPEI